MKGKAVFLLVLVVAVTWTIFSAEALCRQHPEWWRGSIDETAVTPWGGIPISRIYVPTDESDNDNIDSDLKDSTSDIYFQERESFQVKERRRIK